MKLRPQVFKSPLYPIKFVVAFPHRCFVAVSSERSKVTSHYISLPLVLQKILGGMTSLEEVLRVTRED